MPKKVDEQKVFTELLKYRLDGRVTSEHASVQLRLRPLDNHAGDSPDFLLWVELEFEIFSRPVKLAVPIPIEAEKGGIDGGALDDLRKFVDRRKHVIELPMIVVSEAGYASKTQLEQCATRFTISQCRCGASDGDVPPRVLRLHPCLPTRRSDRRPTDLMALLTFVLPMRLDRGPERPFSQVEPSRRVSLSTRRSIMPLGCCPTVEGHRPCQITNGSRPSAERDKFCPSAQIACSCMTFPANRFVGD